MAIVTISREIAGLGEAVGQSLARKLNYEYLDRKAMLDKFLGEYIPKHDMQSLLESPKHFFREFIDPRNGSNTTFLAYLQDVLPTYAASHPGVWVGFAADQFLAGEPDVTHIRIIASMETRIKRLVQEQRLAENEARNMLQSQDRIDYRFAMTLFDINPTEDYRYDLVINTDKLSLLAASNAIVASWKDLFARKQLQLENKGEDGVSLNSSEIPILKNEAEIEVARLLDRYGVEWRYEPKTFPVEWDDEGRVTMAFSPDFYLTEFDSYLELTTMDQRYVTKKNKKAKKAKELYGVDVKIVYRKDFEGMIATREAEDTED